MVLVGVVCVICGFGLLVFRLPVIGNPRISEPPAIKSREFLDIVIEEQLAGHTTFGAVVAALEAFGRTAPEHPDEVPDLLSQDLPSYASLWRVLFHRGEGLLEAAQTLRTVEIERDQLRQELEVKVTSTRATMRMLLWLPWAFLIFGQVSGMGSISILLTHIWGYPLIAVSALLSFVGRRWIDRMICQAST